jgi:hypothetical protein
MISASADMVASVDAISSTSGEEQNLVQLQVG